MGIVKARVDGREVKFLNVRIDSKRLLEAVKEIARSRNVSISLTYQEGVLKPGDVIVCIAVAASHRDHALETIKHVVDMYKDLCEKSEECKSTPS